MLKKIASAFIVTAAAVISLPAAADNWDNALGGALGGVAGATVGDALGAAPARWWVARSVAARRRNRGEPRRARRAIIGGALGGGGAAPRPAMDGRPQRRGLGAALGGGGARRWGNLSRNARERDDARDRDNMRRMRRNKHRYDDAYYD